MNQTFDRDRITQPDRESQGPRAGSLLFSSSLQKRGLRVARPTRQNAYRSHGFSMIELLIVVICISILMAIAIPSVLDLRGVSGSGAIRGKLPPWLTWRACARLPITLMHAFT